MKVLHVNNSDCYGGAAKAALRLHNGLLEMGMDSRMIVQDQRINAKFVCGPEKVIAKIIAKFTPYLDRLPLLLYSKNIKMTYHTGWLPDLLSQRINEIDPDIIHLHWICDGFLNLGAFKKIRKPVVWTLHDMWPFTGGCHYSGDCFAYKQSCGNCPQLGSKSEHDLSRWIWRRKSKLFNGKISAAVSPSHWIGNCAKESGLFKNVRIKTIPNGIDLNAFRTIEKSTAKEILNIPKDRNIILFGSIKSIQDKRKGHDLLLKAINLMSNKGLTKDKGLLLFGDDGFGAINSHSMPVYKFGYLADEISLRLLYSASDVFVLPTMEDNLPNTIMESMSCGTPCVSFNVGGVPDMIRHKKNGYIAEPFDIEDLAEGIGYIFKNDEHRKTLSENATATVKEKFDIQNIAESYEKLYTSVV